MKSRVFPPIGIENSGWDVQGGGGILSPHTNSHSGLRLSARDFARLGYLLLRGGTWKDKQIVPKWWIDLAIRESQELNPHHGYTFWVNSDGELWPHVPTDAFALMGMRPTGAIWCLARYGGDSARLRAAAYRSRGNTTAFDCGGRC